MGNSQDELSKDFKSNFRQIISRGGRRFVASIFGPEGISVPPGYKDLIDEHSRPFYLNLANLDQYSCLPTLILSEKESHHASRVLRIKDQELVSVFDPLSQVQGLGKIEINNDRSPCGIKVHFLARILAPQSLILVGMPKPKVAEIIIEKATEIGTRSVIFFNSNYSGVTQIENSALEKSLERLQRIRNSALKQSYSNWAPEIHIFKDLESAIKILPQNNYSGRYAGDPGSEISFPEAIKRSSLNIKYLKNPIKTFAAGPEGGFSPEEYQILDKHGFNRVSLGGNVLRVETAITVALGFINLQSEIWHEN
ncbi:MAG TPA: RsmE family RNA methyltransferase [Oligoflexia bacterium]|nr:RsmE family RNA methyltransferase [Oligoflexia bacterium]HMP47790.1 RsmE family RNA methyltransferase [Oligoflexia bacterium]